jgi:23S rRNA (cytidine2498-2'-O)-methyltransferase
VERQKAILPELARAAWRKGIVTFRLPPGFDPPDDFFPDLLMAQVVIRSFGQATGASIDARADAAVAITGRGPWDAVHVWRREPAVADRPADGSAGDAEKDVAEAIHSRIELSTRDRSTVADTMPGDLIFDCVIDSPDRWWIGWHRASTPVSCRPGGMHPRREAPDKVSRAWLKLDEAIDTSGIRLAAGDRACELGASPGGACQRLLEAGLRVVGIDPALVDPRVAEHPRFEPWRMRARDVKLKAFRGFDWFVADMNIDPTSTMESLGRILTAPGVRPKGVIATLKLPDWSRAAELGGWLDAFRGWGFEPRARQLSTAGREVFVAALRGGVSRRSTRRPAP